MKTPSQRAAARYARNYAGSIKGYDHSKVIRVMPCLLSGTQRRIQAAHVSARGMGGAKGDWRHLVPLSASEHLRFDTQPHKFRDYKEAKRLLGVLSQALAAYAVEGDVSDRSPMELASAYAGRLRVEHRVTLEALSRASERPARRVQEGRWKH